MQLLNSITTRKQFTNRDMWGRYLLYLLSKDPRVTFNTDHTIPYISVFKESHLIPFKMNDKFFFIDDWDYHYPTSYLLNSKIPNYYLENNIPTILKIQYSEYDQPKYDKLYEKYKIKVLPFITFPNRCFNLENYQWKNDINYEYLCFSSGKPWRERSRWIHFMNNQNDKKIVHFKQGIPNTEYEDLLTKTRWGLILKGKGVGKNRREVEYMSFGMPIVLNYKPHYPFDYKPNEHYVYLEKPKDIEKLKDIDPIPYANKSIEIYNKYYSVKSGGLYNSFNNAYIFSINHST